jgi:hypothetical protein
MDPRLKAWDDGGWGRRTPYPLPAQQAGFAKPPLAQRMALSIRNFARANLCITEREISRSAQARFRRICVTLRQTADTRK